MRADIVWMPKSCQAPPVFMIPANRAERKGHESPTPFRMPNSNATSPFGPDSLEKCGVCSLCNLSIVIFKKKNV
ncbi:hypothetical protein IF2G_06127 [Cordyceps javanica]|nr:hypothetical protein IF2G_06127 [Cordyceps javanica]